MMRWESSRPLYDVPPHLDARRIWECRARPAAVDRHCRGRYQQANGKLGGEEWGRGLHPFIRIMSAPPSLSFSNPQQVLAALIQFELL